MANDDIEHGEITTIPTNKAPQTDENKPHPLLQHKKSKHDIKQQFPKKKRRIFTGRRALLSFYNRQNDIIDSLVEMDDVHEGRGKEELEKRLANEEKSAKRALYLSFGSNVVLLAIRIAIAVIAGSLSLIVATMDAVLDVLSSTMMVWAAWEVRKPNKYKYPVGKHRLEPLGVIVFSTIMGTAAFTIIIEGIKQLIAGHEGENDLPSQWFVIGATIFVVIMKLAMYIYCREVGKHSASAAAFATDHLNDVIVNISSLAGALLGANVAWWLDPTIAIILSLYVIYSWGRQGLEHVINLVGVSASPEILQKLTYLCMKHQPDKVKLIDTVKAYTVGEDYLVEVDIVLDENMILKEAHDIGEDLQNKIEGLPNVARAFVHLDVNAHHTPEH